MVQVVYTVTTANNDRASIEVLTCSRFGKSNGLVEWNDSGTRRPVYRFEIADILRAARRTGTVSRVINGL